MAKRTLILGGYGQFGARISQALARHGESEIWIAGRDQDKADGLALRLRSDHPNVGIRGTQLDITNRDGFRRALEAVSPDLIIHTAGPFQDGDYAVAEAAIEFGCHYIDLADGRRFVADFAALNERASARDVLLVSGASTLPGLSSAIVDLLKNGMRQIRTIDTSIVPAGRSLRGRATIAGVLSYCGRPVRMLENGVWSDRIGWQDVRHLQYPNGRRRVAVCDVPDLELFPERYPGVETVSFRAGPELLWEHLALRIMASMTQLGLVGNWARYAGIFERISRRTARFGSDTGGMQVLVSGMGRDGTTIERRWDLIAGSNHGPEIPCIPTIALAKKLIAGDVGRRGAMACLGLIGFEDFALEAQAFDIDWNLTRLN